MKVDELPPHNPFWERPAAKSQGDEFSDAIFLAIGISLTKWEIIETFFALIFKHLVESQSNAALRAYGSIASARGRRDALEAAAETFFRIHDIPNDQIVRFDKLIKHFGCASTRRNEIAHGTLCSVTGHGCFLMPPDYNTNKTDLPKARTGDDINEVLDSLGMHYRYTSEDISHFKDRFTVLGNAVIEYRGELQRLHPQ